jgi:putative membrane protein
VPVPHFHDLDRRISPQHRRAATLYPDGARMLYAAPLGSLLSTMLWLKAFHIVFVVTWFAGLFYLPRLFVYHVDLDANDEPSLQRFETMERRLFVIMTMGAAWAALFGFLMILNAPGYLAQSWLQWKLALVAVLAGYHLWCYALLRTLRARRNAHSQRWYRAFNEAPTVLLIAIILLAVVKP